jgi:predicted branched-subunit amino acid permease
MKAGRLPGLCFCGQCRLMTTLDSAEDKPYWSGAGFRLGLKRGLTVSPGIMVFGLVVGAAAERQGLSGIENIAMNLFVCSGIAQLVALEAWPSPITWSAVTALALIAAVLGARMVLMGVSLRPWFGELPAWQTYSALFLLNDSSWLIAMRYHAEGGRDAAVYLGAGVTIVGGWMIATCAGYVLGGLIVDPARYGLDMVMPVFFAAMLVPLWKGRRRATGWIVAGVVALAVQHFVPGWWFIIAGSLAGALAGAFFDETARP